MHINKYKSPIIKVVHYHYPTAKVYLYGSWATGKNKSTPDIDIAVDAGQMMDFYEYSRLIRTVKNLDIQDFRN